MYYFHWFIIFFLSFVFLLPQQEQTQEKLSETVQVDLIDVYLSATDSKGRPINDLKVEELSLKEDGIIQKISEFSILGTLESEVPLLLALVIDISNSMHEGTKEVRKIDIAKDAGREVIRLLRPRDQIMLITFDTRVAVKTELSSSPSETERALSSLEPNYGRTALWDAIHAAAEKMKMLEGRKVILVCSDGLDNASDQKEEDVISQDLAASEITIVAIGTTEFERGGHWHGQDNEYRQGKETMEMLANRTGGYAFFPDRAKKLPEMLQKVRTGIWNWYSIVYRTSNPEMDGNWREIEIDTKRKGAKLRYRRGYFANP